MVDDVVTRFGTDAPAMILEATQYAAVERVKSEYGNLLVKLLGNPTREERDTWERQRDWAHRCLNGDSSADELLVGVMTQAERDEHGEGAAKYIANVIIGKNAKAEQLISVAGGVRRTTLEAIYGATTPTDVEKALTEARNNADAAIEHVLSGQS